LGKEKGKGEFGETAVESYCGSVRRIVQLLAEWGRRGEERGGGGRGWLDPGLYEMFYFSFAKGGKEGSGSVRSLFRRMHRMIEGRGREKEEGGEVSVGFSIEKKERTLSQFMAAGARKEKKRGGEKTNVVRRGIAW